MIQTKKDFDYDILDVGCGLGSFGNYLIEHLLNYSYPTDVDNYNVSNSNNDNSIHIKIDGIDISNYAVDYLKSNLNKKLANDFGKKIEQISCDYNMFIEAYGFDLDTNISMIHDTGSSNDTSSISSNNNNNNNNNNNIDTTGLDASETSKDTFVKQLDVSDNRKGSKWRDFLDDKNVKKYDLIVSNDFFLQSSTCGRPGLQGLYDCLKLLKPNGTIVIANSRSVVRDDELIKRHSLLLDCKRNFAEDDANYSSNDEQSFIDRFQSVKIGEIEIGENNKDCSFNDLIMIQTFYNYQL